MRKVRDKTATRIEYREYSEQLYRVVAMQFAQHRFREKLERVRGDVESAIQEASLHLLKQTNKGFGLRHEGWRPMMSTMNMTVLNFVRTELVRATRHHNRAATATDYFAERIAIEEPGLDGDSSAGESRDIEGLAEAMQAAEDMVIGDIVCRGAREQEMVERCFKTVQRQVLDHQTPLPYESLPQNLKGVGHGRHLLIIARVLRSVRDFAGG